MDTTASSFTLRKNAKRAAEAMIRKGTAPAVDYGIKPSDDGRFEIVWKSVKAAPTTDEVETEIAEPPANQPAAASPSEAASQPAPAATELATTDAAPQPASEVEAASQPAPAATEPAPALSEPAPKNEWPHGTRVMVRKRKSWREATIVSRLDPDHWRAEYPGGGSGMFQEADIRAYEAERDATPAKQPRRATATAPQKSSRSRYAIDPEAIAAGQFPDMAPVVTSNASDSTRVGVHIGNPGLPIRPFDNLMADLRVFRCLLRVILGVGRDPIATAAIREPAGIDHRDW
jgi:hypothetical protein